MTEPRPSLVACTVHFSPAIHGNRMASLSGALRREYPHASAPQVPSGPPVFFSAPDRNWAVWLTPFAIGLETRHFQEFGELHDRLGAVMRLLDPGLYRRVGLRCVYQDLVNPRPLAPDQQHLSQVVQWRSHGGRMCLDLDVSVENVPPARLDESLEEIFRASHPLVFSHRYRMSCMAGSWAEPDTTVPPLWATPPTTVAAFPELLPFEPEPAEVETVADERAGLLARKYNGEELSRDEQERLATLTARLEKLLPPVSIQDLENLLEMAEEAEHIRQWARESRQSLGLK